ncbi:MAG TPA: PIG-L family deacetylase [Ilumatobacter sp.]|nr:PIG-L family deacetylase [Ilumatobacter sp.]
MATLVFFHAHPDDESILTGGSIARAADEGHRVVLVTATDGRHGEVPDDLAEGESLADRRRVETERSAAVLGAQRVAWLGYGDSGMTGWEQNGDQGSFHQADLDEAAGRLAAILTEEAADVLVTYDWHGNYGHPDHIKVHRVGHRAAELAGTGEVFEATVNRDAMREQFEAARAAGLTLDFGDDFDPDGPADDGNPMGEPAAAIAIRVDVSAWTARKRESIRCHRSQVTDTMFFLSMPDDDFAVAFGTEWYVRPGVPGPPVDGWLVG